MWGNRLVLWRSKLSFFPTIKRRHVELASCTPVVRTGGGGQPWPQSIKIIYTLKRKRWMGLWKQLSQCNNKFYVYRETGIFESWPKTLILLAVSWFFFPFCFSAAVGLWNWSYLLFKRRWRFLQMWKVGFRRPFQRFGYYQKKRPKS